MTILCDLTPSALSRANTPPKGFKLCFRQAQALLSVVSGQSRFVFHTFVGRPLNLWFPFLSSFPPQCLIVKLKMDKDRSAILKRRGEGRLRALGKTKGKYTEETTTAAPAETA